MHDKRKANKDRILGLKNSGLSNEFGDGISGVNPTTDFDFSNPPMKKPGSENVILITHIKRSSLRPHIKVDVGVFNALHQV